MDSKLSAAISAAISAAPDNLLVEIVKFAQKQGKQGSKGTWKGFLNSYDRKFGSCISDPSKRPRDALVAFLNTFTSEEDLKFLDNVLSSHANFELMKQIMKESPDKISPEQKLVNLTLEHPKFLSNYIFPSYNKEWAVTNIRKKSKLLKLNKMLAVDCEMVLCEDGTEAVVKVCVVDGKLQVKLNQMVNPYQPVADYRTEITGISAADLDGVSCSLADVQKSMKNLLSKGAILAGHSLYNDLLALKLDHTRVIDTSFIFKTSNGRTPSLNNLCKWVLGDELRKEGASHVCLDDACAVMKLILAKLERGVDNEIPLVEGEESETESAKLFLHMIPYFVSLEELRGVFPGIMFELEVQKKNAGARNYSVRAIFKNKEEALQAFENLDGSLEKDSYGRPQKLVKLHLIEKGKDVPLYVREVVQDSSLQESFKKRASEDGENPGGPKKLKIENSGDSRKVEADQYDHLREIERLKQELKEKVSNQCDDHLKEIEKLKQDIRSKDLEISIQDKIIINLKKKLEGMKTNPSNSLKK